MLDLYKNNKIWFVSLLTLASACVVSFVFENGSFSLLGMLGALFANATGAGGGVVFIPAFQQLAMSEAQTVATSFAIQCFGMTTGAILWHRHATQQSAQAQDWLLLKPLLWLTVPVTVLGIWSVYGFGLKTTIGLSHLFAYFSILLGLALFVTLKKSVQSNICLVNKVTSVDVLLLLLISYFGGAITAWLSVGVGEFVAFYLILRGYRITLAITTAVILTAFTVWSAVGYHLAQQAINFDLVIFAGPGAIIGALVAKHLASRIPVIQLKAIFAGWILFAGVFELAG